MLCRTPPLLACAAPSDWRCSKVGRVLAGHEIYKPTQINYRLHWERESTGEALFPLENGLARHSRRGGLDDGIWINGNRSMARDIAVP